jgi:hypothetical protein
MFPQKPYDLEFSLAFSLLSAWSVADDELRPKLEALIAEHVERTPAFLDALKRVTAMSEQLHVTLSAARTGRAKPEDVASSMMRFMKREA